MNTPNSTILNIEHSAPNSGERTMHIVNPAEQSAQKKRVAGYARVSSDSDDQLNSFQSQIDYYGAKIHENPNWELVDIYADEAETGLSTVKRDDFNRLMNDCRNGKIDLILVKSVSRFARNFTDCIENIHELRRLGVTVIFEKENIDTSKMSSEMLLSMQAMKAQRESMSISGNMMRGNQMRMKSGTFIASSTPYGYRLNGQVLEIHPGEAEIVKRIFADYLSGKGQQFIADELNAEGIPSHFRQRKWYHSSLQYILSNISYVGDSLWQKTYSTNTIPLAQVKNRGEMKQYYVKNDHEAIISREDFDKVQRLIAIRTEKYFNGEIKTRLLTKKVHCGECGSIFRHKNIRGNDYWTCRTHDGNKERCSVTQIPESEILSAFQSLADKLRKYSDYILLPMQEQLEAVTERKQRSNSRLAEINKEIAEAAGQAHTLHKLNASGVIDPAIFIAKTNEFNQRLKTLRQSKIRILDESGQDDQSQRVCDLIDALNAELDYDELFGEIVECVIVQADDVVQFKLNCGLQLTETVERAVRNYGAFTQNSLRIYAS
jgi:DNA invertase Pin-like site-specific DNA recombinase